MPRRESSRIPWSAPTPGRDRRLVPSASWASDGSGSGTAQVPRRLPFWLPYFASFSKATGSLFLQDRGGGYGSARSVASGSLGVGIPALRARAEFLLARGVSFLGTSGPRRPPAFSSRTRRKITDASNANNRRGRARRRTKLNHLFLRRATAETDRCYLAQGGGRCAPRAEGTLGVRGASHVASSGPFHRSRGLGRVRSARAEQCDAWNRLCCGRRPVPSASAR